MIENLHQVIQVQLRKSKMDGFGPNYQTLVSGRPMAASDHLNKLSQFSDNQELM